MGVVIMSKLDELDYIVIDLEFTQFHSKIMRDKQRNFWVHDHGNKLILNVPYTEIIEIGAVRVRNNKIIDKFHTYIQPANIDLSYHVTKLTGITSDKLVDAPYFTVAFNKFTNWIKSAGRPVRMCSWSTEDRKQLYHDCYRQMVKTDILDEIFANQLDVQKLMTGKYNQTMKTKNRGVYGLDNAVRMMEIESDNQRHTALGDAEDAANIMIAIETGYLEILKNAKVA